MSLCEVDGRTVRQPHTAETDVVIVGSGPAGAVVARHLSERGIPVIVVEEGHPAPPQSFSESGLQAMASLYRDMGTSIAFGNLSMPYLQGRVVGGTSVINGAICWKFPREVWEEWVSNDRTLADALPFESISKAEAQIEKRLNIHSTTENVAGRKNLLLGQGAETLGVQHRPIARNVSGCVGEGRCLQGCPHGHKLSMDRSYLPDAVERGGRIWSGMRVDRVVIDHGRARGVVGRTAAGAPFQIRARRAVVLAASAIQTPVLLRRSGVTQGPVGDNLCAHPGVSVTGLFKESVVAWRGATQGHEVIGYRSEGIKLEALGFDLSILASRVPGVGSAFAKRLANLDKYAVWGAALRAKAKGRVRPGVSRPWVTYSLTPGDIEKARRAVRILADLFLAAGALEVYPSIAGFHPTIRTPSEAASIESEASLNPSAYSMSMTHLFGTAKMGSDPQTSVVRPTFETHQTKSLFVADSSVFPDNLGVNPQVPIMALADLCAASLVNVEGR
ncbi:MAG: GMC family oxidoreductase [Polyangiaceae bacterium]|nr:GMC family oxidoreductase [Polyangiaceae bacterium]